MGMLLSFGVFGWSGGWGFLAKIHGRTENAIYLVPISCLFQISPGPFSCLQLFLDLVAT